MGIQMRIFRGILVGFLQTVLPIMCRPVDGNEDADAVQRDLGSGLTRWVIPTGLETKVDRDLGDGLQLRGYSMSAAVTPKAKAAETRVKEKDTYSL
jgi:hypothetical protein